MEYLKTISDVALIFFYFYLIIEGIRIVRKNFDVVWDEEVKSWFCGFIVFLILIIH